MQNILNEIEAAERLRVSAPTLRRWRHKGEGPLFLKIGGAVRYREEDLAIFINECSRQSTSKNER